MPDPKLDPTKPAHIAAFRAMDDYHAKVADIKTLPVTGDEIQFRIPDIHPAPLLPEGTVYMLPPRRMNETEEEYASRCVIATGIGD
jgi:hypothetical protein